MEKTKDRSKLVSSVRVTADSLISPEPCFVLSAELVSSAAGVSTAALRDGHNTDADILVDLAALASAADPRSWTPPIYFQKGLFVDIGANVTAVLVRYF